MATDNIKLFGKWSYQDLTLGDITLEDFVAVNKGAFARPRATPQQACATGGCTTAHPTSVPA